MIKSVLNHTFFLLACFPCADLFSQQWSGFKSGEKFDVRISHTGLKASPIWDPGKQSEPQISVHKAYQLANDKLFSVYPNLKRHSFRNEIVLCSLWNGVNFPEYYKDSRGYVWSNKSLNSSVTRWLYCINFTSIPTDGMTGIECKFGVAVLMDGSVVLPVSHREPTEEELNELYDRTKEGGKDQATPLKNE